MIRLECFVQSSEQLVLTPELDTPNSELRIFRLSVNHLIEDLFKLLLRQQPFLLDRSFLHF